MRLLRFGFLVALILACNALMLAFDPGIHVDDPQGSFTPVGLSFTFTSDAAGGGVTNFTNTSGVAFTTLEIYVAPPMPLAPITCGGNAYTHCYQDLVTEGGFATIDFFGGLGIPNGMAFDIDLGATGWTPNATFFAFANEPDDPATPEPGMFILIATGATAASLRLKALRQD